MTTILVSNVCPIVVLLTDPSLVWNHFLACLGMTDVQSSTKRVQPIRLFADHNTSTYFDKSYSETTMQRKQALFESTVAHPVTYLWTNAFKDSSLVHRNLSVTCSQEDDQCGRTSWNGVPASSDCNDTNHFPQRLQTTELPPLNASPSRLRLIYDDEDAKDRVCSNVQRLLKVVQQDPEAKSANAQLARKVLKYRRVMERLGDVNVEDPHFDASAFFGIEWRRVGKSSR
ncbi:hypothetical protein CCR75_001079 [Bremia lactucae]|uniref:Uncharacterized protein n=1 Tax=Bremia lactucae TaxID=4779 RepID=A0A976NXT1_BRELC|nr:hypothetical protein CCR75_001079 [Bremia lactucae]